MKKITISIALLGSGIFYSQVEKDSTIKAKEKEIEAVTIIAKKPTVESKIDRTVFNVANSSIVAGNTTWDVLKMTPLVSINNNDELKAQGESVVVYINDRKSVFSGKELKEYLQTISADNIMKIEVITSPSSRYEASGTVINIVLKKRDDEGIKGSLTLNNKQNRKNSQYSNLNLNYHKKNFTQTFMAGYSNNIFVEKNSFINHIYENNDIREGNTNSEFISKTPYFSSTSEYELNDKNTIGVVIESYNSKSENSSTARGTRSVNSILDYTYEQNQNSELKYRTFSTNVFYKYYHKEKNKILDINLGSNYDGESNNSNFIRKTIGNSIQFQEIGVNTNSDNRNYYIKVDYTQPVGETGGSFEVGGKIDFNNNRIPNEIYGNMVDLPINKDVFQYKDQLSSLYANYSQKFFEKLEARVGVRYEYIDYKIHQEISGASKREHYGNFLPSLLIKYTFSDNYDLSLSYNHYVWRPWYREFNTFIQPTNDGFYTRGNMNLLPNPRDVFYMKFGILKKYFLSARYSYTNQDYWSSDTIEDGKIITEPTVFLGKSERYYLFANTNQSFLKNKLNVNLSFGWNYIDNSDFNMKNGLNTQNNYLSFWTGSTNLTYTNLFNKNINLSAWLQVSNQNSGNSVANVTNFFHNISATKIFPKNQMEVSLQLINIFNRPNFDATRFSPVGSFRNNSKSDWYGFALTFVKRFGNQKVKENTKTDVEKNSGAGK